jgi:integrase
VIRQLDAHLGSLGDQLTCYETWAAEDVKAMLTTVYVILRDTGRRPGEVASLPAGCLEIVNGEYSLVWDNKKGKRNRRRLPITAGTAQAISTWQARQGAMPAPPRSGGYLFPAITDAAGPPHMDPGNICLAVRGWVDSLAELHSDAPGLDGGPLPFDRSPQAAAVCRDRWSAAAMIVRPPS